MAIANNGRFEDEDQFIRFGELIRNTFGDKALIASVGESDLLVRNIEFDKPTEVKYITLCENMSEGHQIRGFRVTVNGTEIEGECVGHKRIIPVNSIITKKISIEITKYVGHPVMRSISVY